MRSGLDWERKIQQAQPSQFRPAVPASMHASKMTAAMRPGYPRMTPFVEPSQKNDRGPSVWLGGEHTVEVRRQTSLPASKRRCDGGGQKLFSSQAAERLAQAGAYGTSAVNEWANSSGDVSKQKEEISKYQRREREKPIFIFKNLIFVASSPEKKQKCIRSQSAFSISLSTSGSRLECHPSLPGGATRHFCGV